MKPQAIAFIVNTLEVGGAERVVANLTMGLDPRRFHPMVVGAFGSGPLAAELTEAGVEVVCPGKQTRFGVDLISRLALMFRRRNVQLVHTHLPGSDLFGTVAAVLARVPHVVTTRHSTLGWSESTIARRVRRRLQQRIAHVVAVSQAVADHLATSEALNGSRVSVIRNGIDTGKFAVRVEPTGVVSNAAIIGRLDHPKGHSVALQALQVMETRGKSLGVRIVGGGALESSLRALAQQLHLQSVSFYGERPDVATLLQGVDAVLVPSLAEGLPLIVLEAMAAGKLVIASAIGGIPEVITDRVNGLLVPPGDPHALADTLQWAMSRPDAVIAIRRAAALRVRESFDVTRMVAAHEALYDSLLRQVQGPAYD